MRTHFDAEKATESLLYVASKTSGDMYNTMKLLYLADKIHLERYGSLIFGDRYAALPYGPVPSTTYNLIKFVRGGEGLQPGFEQASESFSLTDNTIVPLRDANVDYFSRSDLEALDMAIEKFGGLSFGALKQLTHDDAYHAAQKNSFIALDAIASTLPNAAELIQHLSDPHPGSAS